ncbi:MAG: proline--tRNA ligase [Candidatus Peribacteraceae bacterium]|nr:proline--tRNA ligase [Candidatus Peribacteraceae bacterium]
MAKQNISTRAQNFPQWYQDVIAQAPDLYDESPVTGCITFGPLATALWQKIRDFLDPRLKEMGVENIMLPMLIPESFFLREKEHVEGFAPELATVTHIGGTKLPEPFCVRPTSELLFVDWYARNGRIQSHRDLPLLVNQWCSVMRWEKRPRAFLRTAEFHWHEGHCIFATEESCRTFTLDIINLFEDLVQNVLAIPVVKGTKPAHEVFPGAIDTYTIESMMQDGKALQMGTSHMLSQKFLIDSDGKPRVSFLDEQGATQVPFYDSWAVSTRLLGALVMAHGDDDGIVIPPRLAPVHATVLPILAGSDADNEAVLRAARDLAVSISRATNPFEKNAKANHTELYKVHGRTDVFEEVQGNLTVRVDCRKDARLGDKTFYQIKSGTPIRIELGARDLAEGICVIKSRIRSREEAVKAPLAKAAEIVSAMLAEDQKTLFTRAKTYQQEKTVSAQTYEEVKDALEAGKWATIAWDGTNETVQKLKTETSGGTFRCFPFDAPENATGKTDPISGKPSAFGKEIIVGKAY